MRRIIAALTEELQANGGQAEPGDSVAAGARRRLLRRRRMTRRLLRRWRRCRLISRSGEVAEAGVAVDAAGFGEAEELAAVWRESAPGGGGVYGWLGQGIANAQQLQGKELSYNNLVDLDACWALASEFEQPAVIIVKHTNPCGVALGATVEQAYVRALEADPVSAFGGVIGVNRVVDGAAAAEMAKLFVEAIVAPDFTPEALAAFSAKKNLRLLQIVPPSPARVMKQISGGFLLQDEDRALVTADTLNYPTARKPTDGGDCGAAVCVEGLQACEVECDCVCAAGRSGFGQTVGVGAGQMSRVDAARFGAMKATLPLAGTVAASDAFFPFPDGVEAIANAGATAIIQPGGSVRDAEVIAAADRLGVAMAFTGIRHFRHG